MVDRYAYKKDRFSKVRKAFFEMYGQKCTCCGEDIIALLTLEHKNGDGYLDKKNKYSAYFKAIKKYDPETYGVLCHNCNWGEAKYGICPHKNKRKYLTEKQKADYLDNLFLQNTKNTLFTSTSN